MIIKRFLIIALISIALSFGLLLYIIAKKETALLEMVESNKSRIYAESVATSIKNAMSTGAPETAKNIVKDLNEKGDMKVAVFRYDGSLVFGDGYKSHLESAPVTEREVYTDDRNAAFFLYPLINESRCHRCHPRDKKVIGAVAVLMPVKASAVSVADVGKNLVLFAILLAFSASVAVFVVAKKMLLDPIMVISRGVEAVKKGELNWRINLRRNDELGNLALTFNQMAETIEKAHLHMEQAIRQKTTELRVAAELSTEIFKGNLPLEDIVENFLEAIIGRMGYEFSTLCLVDRETGILSQEFRKGLAGGLCASELSLAGDHPLAKVIREAAPAVKRQCDIGGPAACTHLAVIPILSRQRERCRQVHLCTRENCPAFSCNDDRCWLIPNTLCRSPQCVAGREKIYGCLHCGAFPVLGVLVAGRNSEIAKSSLHSLEVLASEISSAIENQRFIEAKKEDINQLIKLHDISVRSLQSPDGSLVRSIVSSATAFSGIDAVILWLSGGDGNLYFKDASNIEVSLVPESLRIADTFIGRAAAEQCLVETTEMAHVECLSAVIGHHGYLYAAAVPLKFKETIFGCLSLFKKRDFKMSDSEKAFILLFASQAAAAMNTSHLFTSLKTEKEFSDAIFSCAASGIIVLDREGRVLKINGAGAEILQTSIGEIVGRNIKDLYPEAAAFLEIEPALGREVTLTFPGGNSVPIGFNNSPLLRVSEGMEGIIVLLRNMTEIKRLQEELKKKAHFQTMTKVISGVAHEVRNPLFGISSIGQILDRELDSPQHKALIQAMLKETDRMKRLIEELLLYTRPAKLDIRKVDLGPLFDELKAYIQAKREVIDFSAHTEPQLSVNADRDKLIQVLLNLLNNAIDAATGRIAVTAAASQGRVVITISDDGPGIREDDMTHVFDPFFTTKKGGTGLGLPICKKIIEDHGGAIALRSAPGAGTTATVIFAPE
jgi:PAS domain S-box-containing protein